MRRAWIWGLIALVPRAIAAQQPAAPLNDTQQLGQLLFTQSCAVCHLKPNLNAGLYGPALYKELIAGQESAMGALIANGTDRMPGFRYQFEPRQIDAIVEYLKTVPQPAQAGAPSPASRRGPVD
jgi:mono/diheme cytochrome c family protein